MIIDFDHVGIAVRDLDAAVELYQRTLGLAPTHRERVEDQGVEEVLFPFGDSFIQLLGALAPNARELCELVTSVDIGAFLAKRGPGVHHVAYRVEDVAAALAHLSDEGLRLIDDVPRRGSRGTLIAFAHPRDMEGVLVELVQVP